MLSPEGLDEGGVVGMGDTVGTADTVMVADAELVALVKNEVVGVGEVEVSEPNSEDATALTEVCNATLTASHNCES